MASTAHISGKPTDDFKFGAKKKNKDEGKSKSEASPRLVVLLQPREHDDDSAPLLPNHIPEVSHGVEQWPLCGDVGLGSSVVTLINQSISHTSEQNILTITQHEDVEGPKKKKNLPSK